MESSSSNENNNYPSLNHNCLGFSLNSNPLPDLSLFPPFFPPPEDGSPKLEDFLGGSGMYEGGSGDVVSNSTAYYEGLHNDGLIAPPQYHIYNKQTTMVSSSSLPDAPTTKKTADTFAHRTSIYRGVTRHRWTGRYEAHLWDNTCKREGQTRKGRQVYLGGYDKEEKAARAYDLAALKYWGATTTTNFSISDYERELEEMQHMSRQEFVASLRRKSSGFSRGASIYRGVTRHHQHGRWQARIGRVAGNKDLYLGTFSTQEEAAEAYDIAAIKFRGSNAVTNFDISRYDVKSIATSNLPVGGLSNKSSATSSPSKPATTDPGGRFATHHSSSTTLNFNTNEGEPSAGEMISWTQSGSTPAADPNCFNMGFYGEQQQVVDPKTEVSFATPVSTAKANLSALHTLIFGME